MPARSAVAALLLALLAAVRAGAQLPLPLGDQQIANSTRPANQDETVVALGGGGNLVVVWRADDQDGDASAIIARRFSGRTGLPLTGEILVNVAATGAQRNPAVAAAADGRFVVVWEGPDGVDSLGVFGSLREADGTPIVAEFPVNLSTTGDQERPAVAMRPNGDFLVLWQSAAPLGSGLGLGKDIFGRIFVQPGGGGDEFPVNRLTAGDQEQPAAAFEPLSGGWYAAWQGVDLLSALPSIYHLQLLPDGPPPPNVIEALLNLLLPGLRRHVSVAGNAVGTGVAVWEGPGPNGPAIFGRVLRSGVPVGQEEPINLTTTGIHREPAVAVDDADEFVTAWIHELGPDAPAGSPIVVQGRKKSTAPGRQPPPRDGEFQISTVGANPAEPWAAIRPRGNFVVAWQAEGVDDPPDPLGRGALFRRFADAIFAGDFENGATSDWSLVVP